ncbi:MAG: class I SAM-dependent methyltransferase [Armatimonadetes bacterium]|nr:class I SAM-dependent methyltransferase [Armatimonadota bacterium]
MIEPVEIENYTQLVAAGAYERDSGGLFGKQDNVRRCWEDQINRQALRDFLSALVEEKLRSLSRLRVIDLGCGAGEGYEILTTVQHEGMGVGADHLRVMPDWILGGYKGVDISPAMIEKARERYSTDPKLQFEVADLRDGLPLAPDEEPYDIYFSSFGSLSHLDDDALGRVIDGICHHMGPRAVFVGDMVGRYSYEWQQYWDAPEEGAETMRPYSMSYVYPPEVRADVEPLTFPLRFWGGCELVDFVCARAGRHGVDIARQDVRDRSILVGRHMDTAEFNPNARPVRRVVASLHEFNRRTDLRELLFDYLPAPGHPELNHFYETYQMAWNNVVLARIDAVAGDGHRDEGEPNQPCEANDNHPEGVCKAIHTIRNVVANVGWFEMGDPLANIIEPQLGYVLRMLEIDLQQGLGAAHGLLGIFELVRR